MLCEYGTIIILFISYWLIVNKLYSKMSSEISQVRLAKFDILFQSIIFFALGGSLNIIYIHVVVRIARMTSTNYV